MCVSQINYLVLQVAECQFVSSATSLQRFPMLVLVLGCCNVFTTLTQCCLSNIYGCCNVATTLFRPTLDRVQGRCNVVTTSLQRCCPTLVRVQGCCNVVTTLTQRFCNVCLQRCNNVAFLRRRTFHLQPKNNVSATSGCDVVTTLLQRCCACCVHANECF